MARRPTLWIVDPSLNRAEHQGVAEVLCGWSGASRLFRPALEAGCGPTPETGYDTDGVVLGAIAPLTTYSLRSAGE